jgi:ankyrin repeat protein
MFSLKPQLSLAVCCLVTSCCNHAAVPYQSLSNSSSNHGYQVNIVEAVKDCEHFKVQTLLTAGHGTKQFDADCRTPLDWAVIRCDLAMVRLLVSHGADVNAVDCNTYWTPLHWAAGTGMEFVTPQELSRVYSNIKNSQTNSIACWSDIAELLLDSGARLNSNGTYGGPLHIAVRVGNIGMVDLLLSRGADPNAPSGVGGATPVFLASSAGDVDIVKKLLARGADLRLKIASGDCPIHAAARTGSLEVVMELVSKGVNINEKGQLGATPLHWAAGNNRATVVSWLLENGADVDAFTDDGETPLYWAASRGGSAETARLILDKGARFGPLADESRHRSRTPLHEAALRGDLELIKVLLARGADAGASDADGKTVFMEAVGSGNLDLVKLLIQKGVRINDSNKTGRTSLMAAVTANHKAIVEFLIESGMALSAKDNNGDTALHIAAQRGLGEIVELLVSNGADVNAANNSGETPLDQVPGSSKEVRRFIRERGGNAGKAQGIRGKSE